VPGKIDNAGQFNGTSQYVDIAQQTPFDFDRTDPFSISAWTKFAAGSSTDQEIVAKEDDNATGYAVAIPKVSFCQQPAIDPTRTKLWFNGTGLTQGTP